jgi:hypothetical protein
MGNYYWVVSKDYITLLSEEWIIAHERKWEISEKTPVVVL